MLNLRLARFERTLAGYSQACCGTLLTEWNNSSQPYYATGGRVLRLLSCIGDVGSESNLCGPAPGIGSAKRGGRHPLGSRGRIASEAASGSRSGMEVKKRVPYGGHSRPDAQSGRDLGKGL